MVNLTSMVLASMWVGAHAQPQLPKVAVPELQAARGLDEQLSSLLYELLLTELARTGRFEVLGASDVKALLNAEQQRQLLGCADSGCLAEIGGALGVDTLAVASIGRVGNFYLVNLKMIEVGRARVVWRWNEQVAGGEDALLGAMRRGVSALVAPGGAMSEAHADRLPPGTEPGEEASAAPPSPPAPPGPAVVVAGAVAAGQPDAGTRGGPPAWLPATILGAAAVAAGVGVLFGMSAWSSVREVELADLRRRGRGAFTPQSSPVGHYRV